MKSAILLGLLLLSSSIFGQNGNLRGTVTNSEGKAAEFVSIQLKELKKGTTSDEKGEFIISNIKGGNYQFTHESTYPHQTPSSPKPFP